MRPDLNSTIGNAAKHLMVFAPKANRKCGKWMLEMPPHLELLIQWQSSRRRSRIIKSISIPWVMQIMVHKAIGHNQHDNHLILMLWITFKEETYTQLILRKRAKGVTGIINLMGLSMLKSTIVNLGRKNSTIPRSKRFLLSFRCLKISLSIRS